MSGWTSGARPTSGASDQDQAPTPTSSHSPLMTRLDRAVIQAREFGDQTPFVVSPGFGDTAVKLAGAKNIEGYLKRIEFTSKTPWPPANATTAKTCIRP